MTKVCISPHKSSRGSICPDLVAGGGLIIGLNPAGKKEDAVRDEATGGLFLNYYDSFDSIKNGQLIAKKQNTNASEVLIYKAYFKPILAIIEDAVDDTCAWEWCNYDFDEIEEKIRRIKEDVNDETIKCIKACHNERSTAKYQIIVRDLVYYHQTSKFAKLLLPPKNATAIEVVKDLIDAYIDEFPDKSRLKFIYVHSATASHYVKEALLPQGDELKEFGGLLYKKEVYEIPVLLGGALSGQAAIDIYSRERLKTAMKELVQNKSK